MGKKSKATQGSLGRALLNAKDATERRIRDGASLRHSQKPTAGEYSVTEESSLDDFLRTAQLAGMEFTAERENLKIIPESSNSFCMSIEDADRILEHQRQHSDLLCIPRRPAWTRDTSAGELEQLENEAFLDWRRGLAELQKDETLTITPFEKNVEFWRQLWRVIERSHVVVQIVDARNPLLFRCKDLEKYASEVDPSKKCILLLNKADLLTDDQRKYWAEYFDQENISVAFFSALQSGSGVCETVPEEGEEQEETEEDAALDDLIKNIVPPESNSTAKDDNLVEPDSGDIANDGDEVEIGEMDDEEWTDDDDEDGDIIGDGIDEALGENESTAPHTPPKPTKPGGVAKNNPDILSCQELVNLFNQFRHQWTTAREDDAAKSGDSVVSRESESSTTTTSSASDTAASASVVFTVGLVGYPNVGKSSLINALLGHKKVSVSSTPGKTKHFQTIFLEPELQLCDCPGLVMPSFVMSKAEMLCLGILPVDHMRDPIPPVSLICAQLPRTVLERIYGVMLPRPSEDEVREAGGPQAPSLFYSKPQDLLTAFAYVRGFMGHKGTTDWGRAGRVLVKDYINGRLRYAYPPPGVPETKFNSHLAILNDFLLNESDWNQTAKNKHGSVDPEVNSVAQLKITTLVTPQENASPTAPITSVALEEMKRRRLLNYRPTTKSIDDRFFAEKPSGFHVKGARRGPTLIPSGGAMLDEENPGLNNSSLTINSDAGSLLNGEKPWKKHKNHNKKEKLRRIHKELDCG